MTLVESIQKNMEKRNEPQEGETPHPIPALIAPGMTMMVAKPKIGLPILSLGLALEVARGGKVIGREVKAQKILYLAPRAAELQIRGRLGKMLQGEECPAWLEMAFKSMPLDEHGFRELEARLSADPEIRLVFLETFRHRGQRDEGLGYEEMAKLKSLTVRHQIALVVVQPLDQVDTYLACLATGLKGGIDTLAVLQHRPYQRGATLQLMGRICRSLELVFNQQMGCWEDSSQEKARGLTQAREEILAFFRDNPGVWELQLIAAALDKNKTNIANLLAHLQKDGIIRKAYYGHYCLVDYSPEAWEMGGRISKQRVRSMTPEERDALIETLLEKVLMEVKKLDR